MTPDATSTHALMLATNYEPVAHGPWPFHKLFDFLGQRFLSDLLNQILSPLLFQGIGLGAMLLCYSVISRNTSDKGIVCDHRSSLMSVLHIKEPEVSDVRALYNNCV